MLVNFLSSDGGFGFKTAFDEEYSRFSPGVLLMIDSIWSGRRHIGRFSIELEGVSRRAIFHGLRLAEDLMGKIRGRTIFDPTEVQK